MTGFDATLDYAVAVTEARREERVAAELARLGHTVYLPMMDHRPAKARQRPVARRTALFPRYVFLHLANGALLTVRQIWHAHGLLVHDGKVAKVSGRELAPIAEAEGAGLFDQRRDLERLEPGARVRIENSWLTDHVGLLQSVDADERVSVLFHLFGADRIVKASLANVRPIG